jgi:hypothetical protein
VVHPQPGFFFTHVSVHMDIPDGKYSCEQVATIVDHLEYLKQATLDHVQALIQLPAHLQDKQVNGQLIYHRHVAKGLAWAQSVARQMERGYQHGKRHTV